MAVQQPLKWYEVHNWKFLFSLLWVGQAFSLFGSMLVQFALVWWLTDETGSATVLAFGTLIALIPQIAFAPFAGALVDRWNRRAVMIVADTSIALATLWLVYLFAVGAAQVWHIYVIMLVRSMGGAFHWPAMSASTSLMVPKEHLSRVAGLNQMLHGAMNIVAPPIGALLMESLPMQGVLSIDILTAAVAVTMLLIVSIPQPERRAAAEGKRKSSVMQDFRDGLRYVRGWPALLIILGMATMINFLFNPAFSLLPLLVKEHFGGGAQELGWIEAASGIGVVLGGLTLGAWGGFKRKIATSMMGLIGTGIGVFILGLAPSSLLGVGLAGMFITGFMVSYANGPLHAAMQAVVEPDMQGRVFTLTSSAATAMSPLSLAVAGPVADVMGVRVWYVIAGIFCTAMGVWGLFIPALMHMEDGSTAAQVDGAEPVEAAGTERTGDFAIEASMDR